MSATATCSACGHEVLSIDMKCGHCGAVLDASGAHRMLGQVMLGQYELVDVLGQGGMSVVFKGRHRLTNQAVALKILPPELAAHSQVKSRFVEEAKALAALDHPNIVHLYNFGGENGAFVLAMQFVEGKTWERMILADKRLDWRLSCRICVDVLRALEYAHGRGVIHRDMKPSNVLVRDHDGSATVMDFGIAKMTTSTRLTATGQTMGTVRYMSPEQVRGQEVDLRTDLYSLGATLFESLTGETPFDGDTHFDIMSKHLSEVPRRPSTFGVALPLAVEDAVMRCLAKRAEDRFESARDVRKVLEAVLHKEDPGLVETQRLMRDAVPGGATATEISEVLELDPDESVARLRVPRARGPLLVIGVAVAALAAGGIAMFVRSRGRAEPGPPPAPAGPFPGLALAPRAEVRGLAITTDGTVAADRVAAAYEAERARVLARINTGLAAAKQPPAELPPPISELYVVPQAALCMKSAYVAAPPADCDAASFAIVVGDQSPEGREATRPRIYLVASRLDEALRGAVAQAVCDGQPDTGPRSTEICLLASR